MKNENSVVTQLKELSSIIKERVSISIKDVMASWVTNDVNVTQANLSLSKAELASELGVSRPTLNAAIETLQKEGELNDVLRSGNRFLLNMEHCLKIADKLNIPTWKDTVGTVHVIAVSNLKGGTGKSTVTVNLASALSVPLNERKKVLIVDMDPQGSCGNNAQPDLEKSRDILTAVDLMLAPFEKEESMNDYHEIADSVDHSTIVKYACQPTNFANLDIIPSFPTDERFRKFAYQNFSDDMDTALSLLRTQVIEHVIDEYDIILIDCPPANDIFTSNALEAATGIIAPVSPKQLDWSASTSYFKILPEEIGSLPSRGEHTTWIKVLLNNVENEFNRDSKMVGEIQNTIPAENMFLKAIDRSSAFEVASQNFRTVMDIRPKDGLATPQQLSTAKACVNNVARELTAILKNEKGI